MFKINMYNDVAGIYFNCYYESYKVGFSVPIGTRRIKLPELIIYKLACII